jgi:small subunit ribosomal protein S33
MCKANIHQTQCQLFNTTYNPERLRLGNKILRQRLKGPSIATYYPPRIRVIQELRKAYPDWEVIDEEEDERVEKLKVKRQRGKGAPKKRRSAAGMFCSILARVCDWDTNKTCYRFEEIAKEKTWTGQAGAWGLRWFNNDYSHWQCLLIPITWPVL